MQLATYASSLGEKRKERKERRKGRRKEERKGGRKEGKEEGKKGGRKEGKEEGRPSIRLFACHCEVKLDRNVLTAPPHRPSCAVSVILCAHVRAVARVPWLCHLLSGGTFS